MEKVSVCKQKRQYVSDAFENLQSKLYMHALAENTCLVWLFWHFPSFCRHIHLTTFLA